MKKTLFALAAMALVAVSCNKEGGDDTKVTPLDAEFTLTTELTEALPYGQPTTLQGTAVTTATLDSYVLTAVKKSGEEYVAVGEAQAFKAAGNEMSVEFFADSKEMMHTYSKFTQETRDVIPETAIGIWNQYDDIARNYNERFENQFKKIGKKAKNQKKKYCGSR